VLIVGDIHGKTNSYLKLLEHYKEPSVQIGDFGAGFVPIPVLPQDAWFFRGNHDSPKAARESPYYLGDWGMRTVGGVTFFFLGGAWSIDQSMRIEGRDWWRDEELSIAELNTAFDAYCEIKPDIVLSHDGPKVATGILLNKFALHKSEPFRSRTGQALDAMYDFHQPLKWVFGHWHMRWRQTIGRTDFRCLEELGWCQINTTKDGAK